MIEKTFINLPVKDLNETIKFFTKLRFKFNSKFTDENATCMILNENTFVMLLVEKFFKNFIPNKNICDTTKNSEIILALSIESKSKVDGFMEKAINAGAKEYRETQDYGWMYGRAFQDINGHIWEIFYMNEEEMPKEMKEKR